MTDRYDFDIAEVGDRIEYEHASHDESLVGTIVQVRPMLDYDMSVEVEDESDKRDGFYIRMNRENIGRGYYSVDLLDWNDDE